MSPREFGLYDRPPPQNLDAERSVLGAMLIDRQAVSVAIDTLGSHPEDVFYSEAHQLIYGAMVDIHSWPGEDVAARAIDPVTVLQRLSAAGTLERAGGGVYLSELTGSVSQSVNVGAYAKIVADLAQTRRTILFCSELVIRCHECPGDTGPVLARMASHLQEASMVQGTRLRPVGDEIDAHLAEIEALHSGKIASTGVLTGFGWLDNVLGGLQPSDLIIVAARPGIGKSAFMLNIAANGPPKQHTVILSLEMHFRSLRERLMSIVGSVNVQAHKRGYGYQGERVAQAAADLEARRILIEDSASLSIGQLRTRVERHVAEEGVPDLVAVDYLQLLSGDSKGRESRQVEVSEITRGLKAMAKEYDMPVLALSQLNREADGVKPELKHLRESGAIEQDADVVLFLSQGADTADEMNLICDVGKHRNGEGGGSCTLMFKKNTQEILDVTWQGRTGPVEVEEETEEGTETEDMF